MVSSSPASEKSIHPEPRPPASAGPGPNAGEPRQPWYHIFLTSKDKSPRQPKFMTPDSSADPVTTPSTASKKVGWSEKYEYKDPPKIVADKRLLSAQVLSPLTPSAERKATKSILKPHNVPDPIHRIEHPGGNDKTLTTNPLEVDARMLESISKQLAGQDRSSRLDAYQTLSSALKACDNIPDRKALLDKMDLLLQFIKRDMNAKQGSGTLDIQLAKEALVLTSSFLYKKSISDMLTPDFNSYIVDYALKTFEDPGQSKEISRPLMFLLAEQKFSARIMTAERVTKLISALHNIEEFVHGKSIVEQRINVYRTFLRQSRSHMVSNLDWLGDLLSDMLSSHSNIRTAAMAFGEEVGLELGTESKVSSKLMEIFKGSDGRDVKYGDFYADRLRKMVTKKPPGPAPRIWSVVILFLRARPQQVEHWVFIKVWLDVIKVCFNSSDQDTRIATNLAWNRMAFVICRDEKVTTNMMHTLSQPLIGQLQRRDVRKVSDTENLYRKSTISSICNLLYYSMKPNTNSAQLDILWDSYILGIIGTKLTPTDYVENQASAEQDLGDACKILCGLFDSHNQRSWSSIRATNDSYITATELPGLDPKWLRKNASRVFKVLSPIMELLFWEFTSPQSKITLLWDTYISSVSSAAAKEVKTSNDTMICLAFLFGTVYKIWQKGPDGLHSSALHRKDQASFFASFQALITIVISRLGVLPFTERLLSMGQHDDFTVVATPSHRPGKIKGEIKSPLHHLFLLLTSTSPGAQDEPKFSEMVLAILTPFFDARRSSKGKMDLVKDLIDILPADNIDSCGILWTVLANFATVAINFCDDSVVASSIQDTRPLGSEYRSVARILEVGIYLSPKEPLKGWQELFQALTMSATIDSGHGGRAIVVVEPIAKTLTSEWQPNDECCRNQAKYCTILISQASYPKDRQALDAARRRLWGSATAGPKIHAFDPYSYVYKYVSQCLEYTYNELSLSEESSICNLLEEVEALLVRCPKALFTEALIQLQKGIVFWIHDEDEKVLGTKSLSQIVNSLWAKICSLMGSAADDIPKSLNDLEPLLCSGLGSKRVSIANVAIGMWKDTFSSLRGNLQYPSMIKGILSRLIPIADLPLPSFLESEDRSLDSHRQGPVFLDTQTDSNVSNSIQAPNFPSKASSLCTDRSSKETAIGSPPKVVVEVKRIISRKRSRETTPKPGKRSSRKKISTAKLRHEASQIQFEPIAGSSPLSEAYESQILTERQREVRERQYEVALMFSNIRSSPRRSPRSTPSIPNSGMGLPSHSSSKLCLETPANNERQSTPDTQVIENQDAYLASSPTPAYGRSHSKDFSLPSSSAVANSRNTPSPTYNAESMKIPSSPPQITTRIRSPRNSTYKAPNQAEQSPSLPDPPMNENASVPPTSSDEFNATSFPTNFPHGSGEHTTIDCLPNAHTTIDPYLYDPGHTMSTYKSTPRHSGSDDLDATIELTSSEEEATEISLQQLASEQRARRTVDQVVEEIKDLDKRNEPVLLSTPRRSQLHATAMRLVLNSADNLRCDTQKSAIFPDGTSRDEEIFEDAVTSPQKSPTRIQKLPGAISLSKHGSSPLTDLDESSFMRLANSVDRTLAENRAGVGHPEQESVRLAIAPCNTNPTKNPKIIPSTQHRTPIRPVSQSSAIQSVIPETPALQLTIKNYEDIMLLGSKASGSDADSVITVIPRAGQEVHPNHPNKSPKSFSRKKSTFTVKIENEKDENIPVKKRKFDENLDAASVFSGGQETPKDTQSAPPTKKRKGRPAKIIEPANIQNGFTPQSSQSQRFEKVTRRSTRLSHAESTREKFSNMNDSGKPSSAPGAAGASSSVALNNRCTIEISNDEPVSEMELNKAEQEASSSLPNESQTGEKSDVPHDESELYTVEETLIQSQIAEEMEFVSQEHMNDQQEATEPTVAAPTYQSIKERLLGLINDLDIAALSRREVHDIEDVFMDAKSKLYGAGKRGRQLADN